MYTGKHDGDGGNAERLLAATHHHHIIENSFHRVLDATLKRRYLTHSTWRLYSEYGRFSCSGIKSAQVEDNPKGSQK
ncbi:MAG: hypothetical protein AAFU54_07700 [Chloroflexota bacterium]